MPTWYKISTALHRTHNIWQFDRVSNPRQSPIQPITRIISIWCASVCFSSVKYIQRGKWETRLKRRIELNCQKNNLSLLVTSTAISWYIMVVIYTGEHDLRMIQYIVLCYIQLCFYIITDFSVSIKMGLESNEDEIKFPFVY